MCIKKIFKERIKEYFIYICFKLIMYAYIQRVRDTNKETCNFYVLFVVPIFFLF